MVCLSGLCRRGVTPFQCPPFLVSGSSYFCCITVTVQPQPQRLIFHLTACYSTYDLGHKVRNVKKEATS